MVTTRSQNKQMVTRSKNIQKHYCIPYAKQSKKRSATQQSILKRPETEKGYNIPKYWAESEENINDDSDDNRSMITEVEDILRHENKIDFDEAHEAWIANKKKIANGCYIYLCGKPLKNGKTCRKPCYDDCGLYSGCQSHYAWEEMENKYL